MHAARMSAAIGLACATFIRAQELEPRAYSVSPKGTSFAVVAFARSSGDLSFDPALPIEDAQATLKTAALAYVYSLDVFGRSANVGFGVPYVWGPLSGTVKGQFTSVHRSGLGDPTVRFAVNLYGAPAMTMEEFARYKQRTNVGASVTVTVPIGQYGPNALVNIGSNRWAAKPEVGVSHRLGRWYLDMYLGTWIFSANNDFFRGNTRTQDPLGSVQFHASYNITRRMWAAFDVTFYTGGRTSVNDVVNADLQRNSRAGGTIAIPIGRRQSVKVSIATGAVTNIGASFTTVGVAYQRIGLR